jgi:hypothetical protein
VFEKSRFCHISPTIFPHSSFGRTLVRAVSLDLPGLFKHPLSQHALGELVEDKEMLERLDAHFQEWLNP